MNFENLWKDLSRLPEVEAIALGGSRAADKYDEKSDYDLYVYVSKVPEESRRTEILKRHCQYLEISNDFWELEDDCTLKNGIDIDILYRNLDDFKNQIHRVIFDYQASNGYSTCLWHNLLHSRILYDRQGKLETLRKEADIKYPDALAHAVIERNMKLLKGHLPSYNLQLEKAILRNDQASMNHRLSAWMESCFDVLYAINRMTHPGEKRMVEYLVKEGEWLPDSFEEKIHAIFEHLYSQPQVSLNMMEQISAELEKKIQDLC